LIQFLAFCAAEGSSKWIKVKEGKTLQEVLQEKDFIIPAIPGLFQIFVCCA
jgi:hypothetical protein